MDIDGTGILLINIHIKLSDTLLIDWIRIATEIELNYTFDAFVVLHGTDTMAYTSSALSFLLEDLGKTVVCILSTLRNLQHLKHILDIDWSTNSSITTPERCR